MINVFGALVALILAIYLIIRQFNAAYALMLGAIVGAVLGGAGFNTIAVLLQGVYSVTPAVLRILAAGVLAGVLISSGSALVIANKIIQKMGEKNSIFALAFSGLLLTASGVFVDITIVTIAPVALAISHRTKTSKLAVFIALSGGAKAGNIISPNPNTIALAESFNVDLYSLMFVNILPALLGLLVSVAIAKILAGKGECVDDSELSEQPQSLEDISFLKAISGPLVSIILLSVFPLMGLKMDPLIALPIGGFVACYLIGHLKHFNDYVSYGLTKMSKVAILLIATGTMAGVIQNSSLSHKIVSLLDYLHISARLLAPIAGTLLSFATSSTTAAAIIAGTAFSKAIIVGGVPPLFGAAILNASSTVFDSMPHGSYFHISQGAFNMDLKKRLRGLKYEVFIGFVLLFAASILFICIL